MWPAPDKPLGKPVRPFNHTFSAMTVIKEAFFPSLLTDEERAQIAERDRRNAESE